MKKYFALFFLLSIAIVFAACGDDPASNRSANSNSSNGTIGPTAAATADPNDTPTLAYKRLFAAVKSKSLEAIKAEFSKSSVAMAQTQASRAGVTVEEVYRNGFTATTFSDTLPEVRDERVKDNMGAVEVWNARDKIWEDIPFIREGSGWKLAVGDAFSGAWKRPAIGRAAREQAASNSASGSNGVIKTGNFDTNQFKNAAKSASNQK